MVKWVTAWRESGDLLPLENRPNLSSHDVVFLCTPVWGGGLPAPMRSALEGQDLEGSTVLPIVTHGGYGPGDTLGTLRELAPGARFAEPFVIECDQERRQMNELASWLETVSDRI